MVWAHVMKMAKLYSGVSGLTCLVAGCRPSRDDQGRQPSPDVDGGGARGADARRAGKHRDRGDNGAENLADHCVVGLSTAVMDLPRVMTS